MNDSSLVLTHGDVDGMVSAAQIIRKEGSGWRVRFSNARWIGTHLESVAASGSPPARLYVLDIPASSECIQTLRGVARAGASVYWIDHHPWPDGVKDALEQVCATVIHNVSLGTPAGILVGRWLRDDPRCEKIARICYASQDGSDWERSWFRLLSSYVGDCDVAILERLANDQEFTQDDLARIANTVLLEQRADEVLTQEPTVATTETGTKMAVYDLSDERGVYLGSKVFTQHDVDLCLIRLSTKKWQLSARRGSGIDLSAIQGKHSAGGVIISVAGRPQLLSVVCTDPVANDVHQRVVAILSALL